MPPRRPGTERRVLPIIRRIRNRWRLRIALKGAAVVLGASFAAFLISAYGLELLRFSPSAVTALRVGTWAAVAVLAGVFLVRPLLRRIDDEKVALYLEEHEPSLEAAILGAVQVEKTGREETRFTSPELLQRLVEQAVEKASDVEYGNRIEQRALYQASGALGVVTIGVLAFIFMGPSNLRYGVNALLFPTTEAAEVNPYSISVEPGDVTVARGSDQFVTAELVGFAFDDVSVFVRPSTGTTYQRLSMLSAQDAGFELLLLNLTENTDYFVEANGIRSPVYEIEVAELPYVQQIEQTYRFPSYTNLEPRVVEDGGDVAALRGTVVEFRIHSTLATAGGRLLVDDQPVMELEPAGDGTFTARLTVDEPGVYEIELARGDGQLVAASPEYAIDVLSDLPPSISLTKPGRDTPASPIEEVYLEARADDDYGVRDVRLVYSVNGEAEDTIAIFDGSGEPLTEVSTGHTMFLEEWPLEPGDVISYYAIARDNRQSGASQVTSDIYFINVRPFGREYREAEQQGGGGGGGGGGGAAPEDALSELQKQVVSATFNVLRDQEHYTDEQFEENLVSVALAQGRVREQVATLTQRMNNRGLAGADPRFREIAEMLPEAVNDMQVAEDSLRAQAPQAALAPEQRALRVLQKAEETYERFVSQEEQQGGGGGGGGGGGANADDLADLFELEVDKLQNQYETVQRGERQQADEQIDELMEKLDELARRQQQELERQRMRASAQQGGAGGSSSEGQRALAEQAEEAARQLERLARESGDPELQDTARRLREAAEAMRRSASTSGGSQGVAEAGSALDDLAEAQRRLERTREDRMQASAQDAMQRVERLAESQRQVQEELERLSSDPAGRQEDARRILERKDQMVQETQDLEDQLDRMAADARRDDPEAARELTEAAEAIREGQIAEKIAWSKNMVEQRGEEQIAREFEEQIASEIENLRREMGEAGRAAEGIAESRGLEGALDQTRDLVRGTESLARRLENRGQQGEQGQQGQQGGDPQGQEGQQGSGQQGEQGQEGQQGGGQQGQEGQQGGGQQGQQGQGQGQQGGQQGQNNQGGGGGDGNVGDARLGDGTAGPRSFSGGPSAGSPRALTDEEIRQYQREFSERFDEARELQRQLSEDGRDVQDLDDAMDIMDRLRDAETYRDLPAIASLQETLRQSLRRLEFTLRREVEGDGAGRASLSGSDEVPTGFRQLVEEYYRSLARGEGSDAGR